MIRAVIVAAVLAIGATAVVAQGDPIAQRKAGMKDVGKAMGVVVKMSKGESPFNAAEASAAFKSMNDVAKRLPGLFPDTSKTGGETEATPAVWTDAAGFKTAMAKFDADTMAAVGAVKDEASFKAEFGKVAKNCGECHNTFRVKK